MKAMVLNSVVNLDQSNEPLVFQEMPDPHPGDDEVLIKVSACGVCHTELDEIEGRTPPPKFPVIPGHQVIGRVADAGKNVKSLKTGDRVGVAWIWSSCGHCRYCLEGFENLCPEFKATGRDVNGGYAQFMTVKEAFAHPVPDIFSDVQAAPLLCAGAVGYRSVKLANITSGSAVGLTGFGASGHIVLQIIRFKYPGTGIFVFARSEAERKFARELGADWAGDTTDHPAEKLDTVIDTTPVWKPVVEALGNLKPGGRLVINAIRKENIDKDYLLNLDYPLHLWMEKEIKSVANVTKKDVREFLEIASAIPVIPEVQEYRLEDANIALLELKMRKIRGAKVLVVN
ncbi:MAG: zinc-dependent alcohol dehydrogenase family protein [Bacteroidales bacterium]|nr:zinc-dependent alcohol dehydrogenase family protein [Bacteroidales bacterium]